MRIFTFRKIQNSTTIFIGDGVATIQLNLETFNQFEPSFSPGENVTEIQYQPAVFWLAITSGVIQNKEKSISEEYNIYISKLQHYIDLKQEIDSANAIPGLPVSLVTAKEKIVVEIYQYAASKLEEAVSYYSTAERDRWTSLILPEAESYLQTNNLESSPNLVAQQIVRSGITDTTSQEFIDSMTAACNAVITKNISLTTISNHIIGTRGKWTDIITNFPKSNQETEQEAITRILAIDWKVGWEIQG
jgi:hypothetical protein